MVKFLLCMCGVCLFCVSRLDLLQVVVAYSRITALLYGDLCSLIVDVVRIQRHMCTCVTDHLTQAEYF